MTKDCLYCGLQFPATAEFCPECGRLLEVAARVEHVGKRKNIIMTKGCLYCGLQLPASVEFCPECGRLLEVVARVEHAGKIRNINVATGCLYCGLRFPANVEFCSQCGRPIERGFAILPVQESESDWLGKQMKGKADPGTCPKCGARLATRARHTTGTFSPREFSSFQSYQPMRSQVRKARAASAFRRRARKRRCPNQQTIGK